MRLNDHKKNDFFRKFSRLTLRSALRSLVWDSPEPARPGRKNSPYSPYRPGSKEKIPRTPRTVLSETFVPVETLIKTMISATCGS
jgi:hypothetical protein